MINQILEDREKRYNELLLILKTYKMTVLCGKINYPGEDKNTEDVQLAFTILARLLTKKFSSYLKHMKIINGLDGPAIMMVLDMSAFEAKKKAVKIEALGDIGRVFDIDIYTENGSSIGRSDINMETRKCIICGEDGRICTKIRKHPLEEVIAAFNDVIRDFAQMDELKI